MRVESVNEALASRARRGGRFPAALALAGMLLGACTDDGTLLSGERRGDASANTVTPAFRIAAPPTSRAVPATEDLDVSVEVNGEPASPAADGRRYTVLLEPGSDMVVDVRWSIDGLPLWRASERRRVSADTMLVIDDYVSTGEGLDADDDGFSNLRELEGDSDPRDNSSVPGPTEPGEQPVDVRIRRVPDGVAPPVIDGLYADPGQPFDEAVWNGATFVDERGDRLDIDNLLRSENAGPLTQNPDYRWYALHDGTTLYLFVEGKPAGAPISFDDEIVFFDDNLNVHIDADASGGDAYDGVDDYHFGLALADADGGENSDAGRKREGLNSVDIPFPEDIRFATCFCTPVVSWEVAIPLATLGIDPERPFGLELQIDEDNDNDGANTRDRDAKFGWFNPSFLDIGGTESDFAFLEPGRFGIVELL